ncbi:MAG: GNAT family N-acetyltransferase [Paracoccaceae bacterium]
MSTLSARRFAPDDAEAWNAFVTQAKNATFLHDRGFMEYHADRFQDASYLIEREGELVALLPANRREDTIQSHGGLTYGGILSGTSMSASLMIEVVDTLTTQLRADGYSRLTYKPVPHIFHTQPAEEDIYALFRLGAMPVRTDVASAIPMDRRLPLAKGRKSGASKARRNGVEVAETQDFAAFWEVLTGTLADRHDAAPLHSLDEINLLQARFPQKIRLFGSFLDGAMIAGVVMFDCGPVAHAQYIAAAPTGRDVGALDLLIRHLLDDVFADKAWFDFGISTTDGGQQLNVGLSRQKEMFGARSVVFQHYELAL